jgi:hypothetical protein
MTYYCHLQADFYKYLNVREPLCVNVFVFALKYCTVKLATGVVMDFKLKNLSSPPLLANANKRYIFRQP